MRHFFNLKSNFYFLQKLVFAIFCFLLGFLLGSGILKAKALEVLVFDEIPNSTISYYDYDFKAKLDELEDYLKSTDYYYVITLYLHKENDNYSYMSLKEVILFKNKPISSDYILYPSSNGKFYMYLEAVQSVSFSMTWDNHLQQNKSTNVALNENKMNSFVEQMKAFDLSTIVWKDYDKYLYRNDLAWNDYNYNYLVYSSNFDILNTKSYSFKFNDTIIPPNGKFPLSKNFLEKTTYTEDYRFSTKDIKQIEYTFDFSSALNENNMFSHEFNFSTSLNLENATFDIFDYPYLQYTKDGITYELPLNLKTDETENQLMYYDTQINSFKDIQDLKFIVPTEKLADIESDYFIHFDSSLPFTKKIYTKEETLPSYQFYNVYNVNNIDHIEIEFDLNNIPEDAIIPNEPDYFKFKMKYDIKITKDSRGHDLASNLTLDIPKIEYIKVLSDGIVDTSTSGLAHNRFNRYNKYFGEEEYTNTFFANYDYNRTLKLIINCRDINDVFLSLKLSSTLDYKIKIFYREGIEDFRKYYQTIDITGKYAVVFIPKIRLNDGENSVFSYFISDGKFKVEERDTYLKDFTLYKDPVKIEGNNQYYYFYGLSGELHKNDSLYYKNLNYPGLEEAKIQYDSRYFVVSICENDYTCQTVTNPNTGENITPNTSPDDEEWSIDNIFKIVDNFLEQVRDTRDYFNECFNAFWNKVPGILQGIIVFVYIMLHIIVFVRIGGWSND